MKKLVYILKILLILSLINPGAMIIESNNYAYNIDNEEDDMDNEEKSDEKSEKEKLSKFLLSDQKIVINNGQSSLKIFTFNFITESLFIHSIQLPPPELIFIC